MNSKWIGIACFIAMAIASALTYSQLPDSVPAHWNIHGEVDGYASRQFTALFAPVLGALLWALLRVLGRLDPISRHDSTALYLHKAANWLAAFLLVLLGNEMSRLRRNSWAGIRLPWTLNDDEIWRRTHRVGARAFVIAGVITMLAALLFYGPLLFVIVMAAALGAAIFSAGYSYRLALQKRNTSRQ